LISGSVTRRTIQKELSYLSAVITWMTDPEIKLGAPLSFKIKGFKSAQVEPPAKIIPSRRDMLLFLRACNGDYRHYRPLFATAYYTGLRRAELFKLAGQKVDLQHEIILIKGKGGKQRTVPILRQLKPYLKKNHAKGVLFVNKATGQAYDNMDWALERISASVGIPRLTMHVFRHTFAVHAIMSGVSLRTLQLVMGHSSIKVTEKYLKLVPRDLSTDLAQFGRTRHRKPMHPKK
jgi:integrase